MENLEIFPENDFSLDYVADITAVFTSSMGYEFYGFDENCSSQPLLPWQQIAGDFSSRYV